MSDKPDMSSIDLGECKSRDFPAEGVRAAEGELRVSIGRRAYDELSRHAAEDTEHEICGVMLGELCKDAGGPWLHITEVIRGEHTASQGAQVTITHETWNHFHKIKDSKFPDMKYLGWYHSHPDFGIFLSSMDLFIHENFFNAPHQVALVVDPQRGEEGLFCWREGSAERVESFWVGTDEHKFEAAPEPSAEHVALRELDRKVERLRLNIRDLSGAVRNGPEGGWTQTVLLVGILLLLGFTVVSGMLNSREKRILDAEEMLRRGLLEVDVDTGRKQVNLRYVMPPQQFLVETYTDERSGETHLRYRLDTDRMQKFYQERARSSEESKSDEKQPDESRSRKDADGADAESKQ